jgi:hypothetical protein
MRKYVIVPLLFVMMFSCMTIIFPSKTYACSCSLQPDPIKAMEQSKAVFSGKVLAVKPQVVEINGIIDHKIAVHFDVRETWKGISQTQAIVLTTLGEASCGYPFKVGETYLVFASGYDYKQDLLQTSTCSLTKKLANATSELSKLGQGVKPTENVSLQETMNHMNYTNKWAYVKAVLYRLVHYHQIALSVAAFIIAIGIGLLVIRTRKKP